MLLVDQNYLRYHVGGITESVMNCRDLVADKEAGGVDAACRKSAGAEPGATGVSGQLQGLVAL